MTNWPQIESIRATRLVLEPLAVTHAVDMVAVLSSTDLYQFTGGEPPVLDQLERQYAAQSAGGPPDGSQCWLNWVIRDTGSGDLVGYVQATVTAPNGEQSADCAWVVSPLAQGRGVATEAALAMVDWLRSQGVDRFIANIHPQHHASNAIAANLGLVRTDTIEDGEVVWQRQ